VADTPESGGERTEAPTPRRLQRAREAGQAPVSTEASLLALLTAAALALAWAGPPAAERFARSMAGVISHAAALETAPRPVVVACLQAAAVVLAPLLVVAAAAASSVLAQTGAVFAPARLRPDFGRINPLAGLRRLLGPDSAVEAARSALKLTLLGLVLWRALPARLAGLAGWPFPRADLLAADLLQALLQLLAGILLVQALAAVLDLIWVRLRFNARLRMSRHEIREEQKEAEGDPRTRLRLRRLRMARARRRMLAAVPKSTVVVTNPTHYAVALAYDRARSAAPRVVAKGVDVMAEKIREIARENRVPVVPDPPLARALHRLELDQEIPAEHYKAVAEIIAYVWRLRARARAA